MVAEASAMRHLVWRMVWVFLSMRGGAAFGVSLEQPYKASSAINATSSPIAKVVVLITEMKTTVEKEASTDEESYDKYVCWCETNEKEKTASIKAATESIEELTAFVQEAAGTSAELTTEIKGLAGEISEDEASLDSAKEQREKESEAFEAEEADMKETIALLGQAVAKLEKVQLLQKQHPKQSPPQSLQDEALVQVKQIVKRVQGHARFHSVMQKDLFDILGSLDQVAKKEAFKQGTALAAGALLGEVFLPKRASSATLFQDLLSGSSSKQPNSLEGAAAGAKSYNSASSGILGVLAGMKDEFQKDLGMAQKEEFKALVNFQNLVATKSAEIAAATKQKEMKEGQLADLTNKVAEAKSDLTTTEEVLESDTKFLDNVKASCKKEETDYNARVKIRTDEIKALGETLGILTGDEARSLFDKTIAFVQVSAMTREKARDQAAFQAMRKLMGAGRKHHNMGLISMAVKVRLDAFTKVKESLDKMLGELKAQQKEEYEKWETCKKDIDETEDSIKEATEAKEDLDEKHQDLTNALSELEAGMDSLKAEVAEMEVELKKAGEARKAENQLFQTSISDQRATVHILTLALNKLKSFYGGAAALVQVHAHRQHVSAVRKSRSAQPATEEYSKSAGGGGVMQLISKIITDAEAEDVALSASESDAQKAYAELVKDTTASIEAARKAISEKEKQTASATSEQKETEEAQTANAVELEKLGKLLEGTHMSCDFVIKYFDIRQKARSEEMDAITEAKAILSGADFK